MDWQKCQRWAFRQSIASLLTKINSSLSAMSPGNIERPHDALPPPEGVGFLPLNHPPKRHPVLPQFATLKDHPLVPEAARPFVNRIYVYMVDTSPRAMETFNKYATQTFYVPQAPDAQMWDKGALHYLYCLQRLPTAWHVNVQVFWRSSPAILSLHAMLGARTH